MPAVHDIAGEPRVSHEDLAASLGYADSNMLRRLIDRNRNELECYGPLVRTRDLPAGILRQSDGEIRGRGQPRNSFLLNEGQTVLAAILSDAPRAAEVRHQVVSVFLAWRAGRTRSNPTADTNDGLTGPILELLASATRLMEASADAVRQTRSPSSRRSADKPRRHRFVTDHGDYWAVRHFVDDCVRRVPGANLLLSDLYAAWLRWQARTGQGRSLPIEAVRDLFHLDTVTVGRGGQIDWRWTQRDLVYTGVHLKGGRRDGGAA